VSSSGAKASYSITSSAMASRVGGTSMPSAPAVAAVSSLHLETFPDAGKNVCDKPTQFDGIGAHGRSISIDLVSRPAGSKVASMARKRK
jgi:hypothetical protein